MKGWKIRLPVRATLDADTAITSKSLKILTAALHRCVVYCWCLTLQGLLFQS